MSTRSWELPYPSARQPVLADRVVATSQPLAVQAGLEMMRRGGNAVDAAIAAAMALTVVEPTSNGIGGDAFAIVAQGDEVLGLNASGRSPKALDVEHLRALPQMPLYGWDTVTVPGAVSAWVALSQRFGRLPLSDLAEPAVRYATDGYPVSPITADAWARAAQVHGGAAEFAEAFLPGGNAPRAGERFAHPAQARTLTRIAQSDGEDFYRGELAERIVAHARAAGAALSGGDLAGHRPEWVETLRLPYASRVVHELPPNGQGIAALLALGILDAAGGRLTDPDSADGIHLRVEAMKLALDEAHRHVADPRAMTIDPAELLEPAHLARRAALIDPEQARDPGHGQPPPGGTVYLTTADDEGRMVSYIQSNYYGFGSGLVVPGTGIALQNRGAGFSTQVGHPNVVTGGARPFHTIIPGLVSGDDGPQVAFGVMGGPMQPQGHLQVLDRILDHGQNPQAASDAPRWRVESGLLVALERGIGDDVGTALQARGHALAAERGMGGFGGAQIIQRIASGWLGASDHRKDGHAAGF